MPSKLSTLIAALSANEADRRVQATEQLAQLGAEARPAAVALVLACGDEEEQVRQWAQSALEGMGPPDVADLGQLTSLVPARSPIVGYWATTLLGRLQERASPATEALAKAVLAGTDISVRQRAAWALGEIGSAAAGAVPALKQAAADPDPRLSRLAQEALERIGK